MQKINNLTACSFHKEMLVKFEIKLLFFLCKNMIFASREKNPVRGETSPHTN